MYRSFLPSLLIAAGVALGACGGTTSGNGGNGNNPPVQASAFATSYAHAICDNVASCCQTNGLAYDANNCLTSAQGIVHGLLVNPAVAAGATYDASAAGDCVAAIKAAVTACSDDMATQNELDAACKGVYS